RIEELAHREPRPPERSTHLFQRESTAREKERRFDRAERPCRLPRTPPGTRRAFAGVAAEPMSRERPALGPKIKKKMAARPQICGNPFERDPEIQWMDQMMDPAAMSRDEVHGRREFHRAK